MCISATGTCNKHKAPQHLRTRVTAAGICRENPAVTPNTPPTNTHFNTWLQTVSLVREGSGGNTTPWLPSHSSHLLSSLSLQLDVFSHSLLQITWRAMVESKIISLHYQPGPHSVCATSTEGEAIIVYWQPERGPIKTVEGEAREETPKQPISAVNKDPRQETGNLVFLLPLRVSLRRCIFMWEHVWHKSVPLSGRHFSSHQCHSDPLPAATPSLTLLHSQFPSFAVLLYGSVHPISSLTTWLFLQFLWLHVHKSWLCLHLPQLLPKTWRAALRGHNLPSFVYNLAPDTSLTPSVHQSLSCFLPTNIFYHLYIYIKSFKLNKSSTVQKCTTAFEINEKLWEMVKIHL